MKENEGYGPKPYSKSMSRKPAGFASHMGDAGRGGVGKLGGADQLKGMKGDVEHPQSHSAFEGLGAGETADE